VWTTGLIRLKEEKSEHNWVNHRHIAFDAIKPAPETSKAERFAVVLFVLGSDHRIPVRFIHPEKALMLI
jgi:hypothetical protein